MNFKNDSLASDLTYECQVSDLNDKKSSENTKIKPTSFNLSPQKGFKHPYKKIENLDPFNNRLKIAEYAKEAKGVYLLRKIRKL
jgi:hypothetical protein